ncbi:MAG: hypothetical protein LUP94_03105 [Candidatus Methanomethylicus sp.]|nr:hypothetical protein [Candidatus Methanomethylicus sp.]
MIKLQVIGMLGIIGIAAIENETSLPRHRNRIGRWNEPERGREAGRGCERATGRMQDGTNPERLDKIGRYDRGKSLHGKIGGSQPWRAFTSVFSSKAFSIAVSNY